MPGSSRAKLAMSSIVVFARAPVLGAVKTRLARAVGDAAALGLYVAFLDDVCALTAGLGARRVLACAGPLDDPVLAKLAAAHAMELCAQSGGDLGARMEHALDRELARGEACLIIGSDSPTVPHRYLDVALQRLIDHELVLGPATDGGYWLIGARRRAPELFHDLPWSTPSLLTRTLERLRGARVALLPFHYDVDDGDDLTLLCAHLGVLPASIAPATRRALAGLGLL
jgi:rSAM/selenodomain-associated transferase 1